MIWPLYHIYTPILYANLVTLFQKYSFHQNPILSPFDQAHNTMVMSCRRLCCYLFHRQTIYLYSLPILQPTKDS